MRSVKLPDPFLREDGTRVTEPGEWAEQAAHIRGLAEEHMYGTWPGIPEAPEGELLESEPLWGGRAVRERHLLTYMGGFRLKVQVVRPAEASRCPTIVYNATRRSKSCPDEEDVVLRAGYGIVSYDREMIRPDYGMAAWAGYEEELRAASYPELPCGDIMAWGWGSSLVASWLKDRGCAGPLIVTGHSRGGKAALCAGIFDDRFEVVAPMGSGCGGAGCARYLGTLALDVQDEGACETIGAMATHFPTWMCPRYADYGPREAPFVVGDRVADFPIDAHMLRAACAPRAVFTSEGEEDHWANTFGTQLCRDAAQRVYDFLGVPARNGFHIRPGGHAFNAHDWCAMVDFCDIVLGRERKLIHDDTTKRIYSIDLKRYADWA